MTGEEFTIQQQVLLELRNILGELRKQSRIMGDDFGPVKPPTATDCQSCRELGYHIGWMECREAAEEIMAKVVAGSSREWALDCIRKLEPK
jgi:hypothetical protein